MYKTHFGLKKRPFRALPAGNDVFVGPQAATMLAGLKKALSTPDAIVSVNGSIGSGKTTIVNRAVNSIGEERLIVSLGRIQLGHDEVLELLLEEMGADPIPASTVQRFTKFRRLLQEHTSKNTRVIIVVEDARRIGIDAVAELEALTATNAGVSDGANIVLMGDQMDAFLGASELSRLKQRLRLRLSVQPLSSNELHGYFKHCFRLAGNDFDTVCEQGTSELLYTLSDGIPRIANNLVESALTSAAEDKQERVTVEMLRAVAADEYGLVAADSAAVFDVPPEPEPAPEPMSEIPELIPEPNPAEPHLAPETEAAYVEPNPAPEPETTTTEPEPALMPETASVEPDPDPEPIVEEEQVVSVFPELIQDTLPDLKILAPDLANARELGQSREEIPAWERDPTLAQLRPDLDVLEHELASAQGAQPAGDDDDSPESESEDIPRLVPEITLDKRIQAKIDEEAVLLQQSQPEVEEQESNNTAAEQTSASKPTAVEVPPGATPTATPHVTQAPTPPPPVVEAPDTAAVEAEAPQKDAPQENQEMVKIVEDLARARTIDDVDDKMAETLFGEEFSNIAAQIAARVAAEMPANDDLDLASEEPAAAVPAPDFEGAAAVSVSPTSETGIAAAGIDLSPTQQRLATVRALNGTPNVMPPSPPSMESAVIAEETSSPDQAPTSAEPESIENQINTSITQTLKALKIPPAAGFELDDDEEEEKKGLFSRFRKT